MNSKHKIVIIGGGYAGLIAALRLAGKAARHADITLINAREGFVQRIRNHQLAAQQDIGQYSIPKLLGRRPVHFVQGRVTAIDLDQRAVTVDSGETIELLSEDAAPSDSISNTFEGYRYLLFSIAYRMLGSAMDAEDMVQEAYLRYQAVSHEQIDSPKAFLTTVVTRLCLDHLKSAKVQRETYVGPWLPEPVLTGNGAAKVSSLTAEFSHHESILMAFLVLLESLTPVERAVFLLREVFDYDYADIARIVNCQEGTCRQLFSRARKHITDHQPRFKPAPEVHDRLVNEFMQAVEVGDLDGLTQMLAEEVSWWSDGGGKVKAITQPIYGRDSVMKYITAFVRRRPASLIMEITEFNGETALIMRMDDQLSGVAFFEMHDQHITAVRAVFNPDKLAHLMA